MKAEDAIRIANEAHELGVRANLSRANLSGANLPRADLSEANLSEADLSRANLSGANLSGTNLPRANLSGADLHRANLSRANLHRANLYGADLSEANLSGANLGDTHIQQIGPIGSRSAYLLVTRYPSGEIVCTTGCFRGDVDALASAVARTHNGNRHGDEYRAAIAYIRAWLATLPPVAQAVQA